MGSFVLCVIAYIALWAADTMAFGVLMNRYIAAGHTIFDWLESRERSIAKIPFGALCLYARAALARKTP